MKQISRLLVIAGLMLVLAAPAFAASCPRLIKQANDKIATMDQNSDKVKQAKALVEEADKAHKAGNHPESEKKAQEALALLS
jgi:hypothetical protein